MDEEAGAGRLTNNEKAATFIGWKSPRLCRGTKRDRICGTHQRGDEHHIAGTNLFAPDMRKPGNYMRALEALPDNRWPDMCLHENRHWRCSIWNQWNNDIGSHAIYWGGDGETCGEAVVKALAALYDAEHPDV